MSHSDRYLATLKAAAEPLLLSPHAAATVRRMAGKVDDTTDMLDAAEVMVPLILDIEAAADALAADAKRLRATLAEVLADAGATTIRCGEHTASVSAGRGGVIITDPEAIPADLMRQPPPQPDKAAIAKLLKEGRPVPGCVLGNGGPQLTIRTRSAA